MDELGRADLAEAYCDRVHRRRCRACAPARRRPPAPPSDRACTALGAGSAAADQSFGAARIQGDIPNQGDIQMREMLLPTSSHSNTLIRGETRI